GTTIHVCKATIAVLVLQEVSSCPLAAAYGTKERVPRGPPPHSEHELGQNIGRRIPMHSARFLLAATLSIRFVSAQTWNRACLNTTLDQYLNALVKHDPQAAPLFAGFRQTDNGVVVRPGTGTWQSITSLGKVQRSYFDPVTGQAAYLGLIEEGQATDVATLRLKVEDKKITEAEWVIAREGAIGP